MIQLALIGHPVGHSFSADYFNGRFRNENIDAHYLLQDFTSLDTLEEWIEVHNNLIGFNVTSPYKQEILRYIDTLSPEAEKTKSVNCVAISRSGNSKRLIGYNTDVGGFIHAILPRILPHHLQAIILGSGGAARSVEEALRQIGITSTFVSRTPSQKNEIGYHNLTSERVLSTPIIVQATPLGMGDHIGIAPPFPYKYLDDRHLCCDLVYNPSTTLFLEKARQQGAQTQNGLEMLYAQASLNWDIWQGYGL